MGYLQIGKQAVNYARNLTRQNVEAELLTKLHLGKLNEKEERLLQYFC